MSALFVSVIAYRMAKDEMKAATEFNQRIDAAENVTRSLEREICGGLQSPIQIVLPPKELPNEVPRIVIGGKAFKPAAELATLRITVLPGGGYRIVTDKEELASCPASLTPPLPCPL